MGLRVETDREREALEELVNMRIEQDFFGESVYPSYDYTEKNGTLSCTVRFHCGTSSFIAIYTLGSSWRCTCDWTD